MLDTEELLVFTRVVATQSLARAAAELHIPRATVSRRLATLEEKLGHRLLRRTTRSMALTAAGRDLLRHAQLVVDAVRAAEASVLRANDDLRGDVRISLGPFTAASLADVLADFIAAHPAVRLLAHVSNRSVDLRREPFDVAIRASAKVPGGLVARRLTRTRLAAFASPAYVARHGLPTSVHALDEHRCLMGLDETMKPRTHWPTATGSTRTRGVFHSDDPTLVTQLCVRGAGIALLPTRLAADHVARGELVPVLADVLRVEGAISIVYPDRRLLPPQVRALIDWIVARGPAVLRTPEEARTR
jgi:DNA-binding transcriptional LysR family regulator